VAKQRNVNIHEDGEKNGILSAMHVHLHEEGGFKAYHQDSRHLPMKVPIFFSYEG
jgi:hypothetical protein